MEVRASPPWAEKSQKRTLVDTDGREIASASTAFALFTEAKLEKERQEVLKQQFTTTDVMNTDNGTTAFVPPDISTKLSSTWAALGAEEKATYESAAAADKQRFENAVASNAANAWYMYSTDDKNNGKNNEEEDDDDFNDLYEAAGDMSRFTEDGKGTKRSRDEEEEDDDDDDEEDDEDEKEEDDDNEDGKYSLLLTRGASDYDNDEADDENLANDDEDDDASDDDASKTTKRSRAGLTTPKQHQQHQHQHQQLEQQEPPKKKKMMARATMSSGNGFGDAFDDRNNDLGSFRGVRRQRGARLSDWDKEEEEVTTKPARRRLSQGLSQGLSQRPTSGGGGASPCVVS